jgi:alkyl sulfatase BDS1-like metallo-beta-lactamase superfamily hydrolase
MNPVHRTAHRALLAALPHALPRRFDASMARDLDTAIELCVTDADGGRPARYEVRIAEGACTVRRGGTGHAAATLEIAGPDLARLAAGSAAWPKLLGHGRLRIAGDPFVALRFPMLFRLPAR